MKQHKLKTFVGEVHFATALAEHIIDDYYAVQNPSSLANLTVMLPTRRACQSLKYQLLEKANGNLILPKITTISDLNLSYFIPITHDFWQKPPQKIIAKQLRLFMVAKYLFDLSITAPQLFNARLNFASALEYAESFLALRDDFLRAKITLNELNAAITGDYANHWLKSLELFQLTMRWLDARLVEDCLVEAITHQQATTDALCEYWQQNPHPHPIIAAGSTGSAANTAKLLQAIYLQPQGSIVLRELDIWSDDADFNQATPTSANYNLRMLLAKLGASRDDVVRIKPKNLESNKNLESKRGELASIMLHRRNKLHENVVNTGCLQGGSLQANDLQGVEWLECEDDFTESKAICLSVRQALSEGATSIIIISDDDALNIRLKIMLAAQNIQVDISAGIAAHYHPQFNFMLLVAEILYGEYNSANLLALMRHEICAKPMYLLADYIEANMLRAMHPYSNFHEVISAIMVRKLPENLQLAQAICAEIMDLSKHIAAKMPLKTMMELHQNIWLVLSSEASSSKSAFTSNNAAALIEQNIQLVSDDIICAKSEYLSILQQQCAAIREVTPVIDSYVTIIGLLELRLQVADFLIVPRMNEGVFPSSPPPDPWLNNELRSMLGLNYFERKIGLSAHDMAIMMRFNHVLFTRALKENGGHTRSSRLFERLKLLLQKYNISPATHLIEWNAELEYVEYQQQLQPKINPPVKLRPHKISATMCESLFANPFLVYASHILQLRELKPLDDELQAKHFGNILHAALHEAASCYDTPNYLQKLKELFEKQLQGLVPPNQAQFFHAKLKRIFDSYSYEENMRKPSIVGLETEAKHFVMFMLENDVQIELSARIDRIEHLKDGKINIIDYKTGIIPDAKQVESFAKCQLLVAQLIMANIAEVETLEYWDASGRTQEQSTISHVVNAMSNKDISDKLYDCLSYFICDTNAIYHYASPKDYRRINAIDHLARFGEYQLNDQQN